MAMFFKCILVLLAFLFQQSTGRSMDKAAFLHTMLADYDNSMTPNEYGDSPVVINHTINIYRVLSLERDILTLSVWESMSWHDPRLQWGVDNFDIDSFSIKSDHIWMPDIVLLDSVEENNGITSDDINVHVTNKGIVTYVPPKIRKTSCIFSESGLFEDNIVMCSLQYMSWTRSQASLDMKISKPPQVYHNDNQYWRVQNQTAVRNVNEYDCCTEKYVDITYNIQLERIK